MTFGISTNPYVYALISVFVLNVGISHADSVTPSSIPKGIYGEDNRTDAYAAASENARILAQFSVAFIKAEDLLEEGGGYVLKNTLNLQQSQNLCADEAFTQQPSAAFCSGFLVSEDVVITAGHCLDQNADGAPPLSEVRLVFGFAMRNPTEANTRFAKQDVYRIGKVLETFYEENRNNDPNKKDWGTIQLDRPALKHIRVDTRQGDTPIGEALTMIGHPLGLPVKITDGGRVIKDSGNFLKTNLDAFAGNSGSAVFNTASIERGKPMLEGILVIGDKDFISESPCRRVNHFTQVAKGENITKIGLVLQFDDPPPAPASNNAEICQVIPELCRQQ